MADLARAAIPDPTIDTGGLHFEIHRHQSGGQIDAYLQYDPPGIESAPLPQIRIDLSRLSPAEQSAGRTFLAAILREARRDWRFAP